MNKPAMSWWTQLPSPVCRLCRQEAGDPEKLGEFMQKDNLNLHYFCLILSSGLPQRGEDDNGFHGFLPEDIKKEVTRASKKICFICKKKGAAIFCQNERCRRSFHLPCGRERGCISQFFGEYKSFCQKHSPAQVMQPGPLGVEDCILCCENLSVQTDLIQSPCCNHTIYHRNCMQQYAHSSAVHFFKCPQCNNREEFHEEMLRMGIHIPDRDASWELEPGAFSGLYQQYQHCDSQICLYDRGRNNFADDGVTVLNGNVVNAVLLMWPQKRFLVAAKSSVIMKNRGKPVTRNPRKTSRHPPRKAKTMKALNTKNKICLSGASG
ncbi:PHD finger protein 7 isoform X3 [Ornithorhynchus anatinus]|uniref:PHD finger protein 7 isoform X3 n=1 Tax=Ornithorhynchus anatinus TaxID=9258 RepID=UPI000454751B|nr:PHD finger protein 7 isoform X3 [Ornithorhynchus anatinus]